MIFFNEEEIREKLSVQDCIDLMRDALKKLSAGSGRQYLRTVVPLPDEKILGLMPAYYDEKYFGTKVITVFYKNLGTGYPSHQGTVLLFDSEHGSLLSMADGNAITEIRTGAVSAVATDLLAKKDARSAAFIGCGAQARSHLDALLLVRDLKQFTAYDQNRDYACRFAEYAEKRYGLTVKVCDSVQEAVQEADIITTITTSKQPLLYGSYVRKGTHINAVGACAAADRELDSDLVVKSRFFGDSKESVFNESGDFLYPLREHKISEDHFCGEIGDVLSGVVPGRRSDDEITVFEALGLALEDVAVARYLYETVSFS